jgi:hypothetical protein
MPVEVMERWKNHAKASGLKQNAILERALVEWLDRNPLDGYRLQVVAKNVVLMKGKNVVEVTPLNGVPIEEIAAGYRTKFNTPVFVEQGETS